MRRVNQLELLILQRSPTAKGVLPLWLSSRHISAASVNRSGPKLPKPCRHRRKQIICGTQLALDPYSCGEAFGYGVVSFAFHGASPEQFWPIWKLS